MQSLYPSCNNSMRQVIIVIACAPMDTVRIRDLSRPSVNSMTEQVTTQICLAQVQLLNHWTILVYLLIGGRTKCKRHIQAKFRLEKTVKLYIWAQKQASVTHNTSHQRREEHYRIPEIFFHLSLKSQFEKNNQFNLSQLYRIVEISMSPCSNLELFTAAFQDQLSKTTKKHIGLHAFIIHKPYVFWWFPAGKKWLSFIGWVKGLFQDFIIPDYPPNPE